MPPFAPAEPGMTEAEVLTPCLIVDLDAMEDNIRRMADIVRRTGMHLRAHGKMHRSVDIARLQLDHGGARGICCQTVGEAEVFVAGGIPDVLVTNQVRDPRKIDRLARVAAGGASVAVCLDDPGNVAALSEAAVRHGVTLGCLVEVDCGAGRCGVPDGPAALAIATAIEAAPGLTFGGLQAYQGSIQHMATPEERRAAFDRAAAITGAVADHLEANGVPVPLVSGGGTGSFALEAGSRLWTELQCGSYVFLDADYGRILGDDGRRLDDGHWRNALFLLTSIVSTARPGRAVCDAGLKAQSADSGLPVVYRRPGLTYLGWSDEHGVLADPDGQLRPGDKIRLVPGHCDPTCNLHDWYVGVRDGIVETVWPVSARGRSY